MSLGLTGLIAPLVGIAVVGAVAVKTVEVIGNTVNQTQGQLKKKKGKKKSNNIFDMDNVFDPQPRKQMKKSRPRPRQNNNNVFSTGFGF